MDIAYKIYKSYNGYGYPNATAGDDILLMCYDTGLNFWDGFLIL